MRVDAEVGPAAVEPAAEGVQGEGLGHMGVGAAAHLGGDGDVGVGSLAQQPADESLAAAVAVDIGRVEERHAGVDRRVQNAHRVVLADVAPVGPELPAAQTDHRDRATGPAESACLHDVDPNGAAMITAMACGTGRGPTRAELLAYEGRTLADVIAPGLRVLFCGINPGLYTAGPATTSPGRATGSGRRCTARASRRGCSTPASRTELLPLGLGITNVVARATAHGGRAVRRRSCGAGGEALRTKVEHYAPAYLAVLGVTAYRAAFGEPRAALGEQPRQIGATKVWVLPNPSGLNAHYTPDALATLFAELRIAAGC